MNLEQRYQRLHLFPVSLFGYTPVRGEEAKFPNVFAVEKVLGWAGGCDV